jgi:hypothetical protein
MPVLRFVRILRFRTNVHLRLVPPFSGVAASLRFAPACASDGLPKAVGMHSTNG